MIAARFHQYYSLASTRVLGCCIKPDSHERSPVCKQILRNWNQTQLLTSFHQCELKNANTAKGHLFMSTNMHIMRKPLLY